MTEENSTHNGKCSECGTYYKTDMISDYNVALCKWCDVDNYFYSEPHDKFFDLRVFTFLNQEWEKRKDEKDDTIRKYPYQVLSELIHYFKADSHNPNDNFWKGLTTATQIVEHNVITKTDT